MLRMERTRIRDVEDGGPHEDQEDNVAEGELKKKTLDGGLSK
jgi:hypothetical protein